MARTAADDGSVIVGTNTLMGRSWLLLTPPLVLVWDAGDAPALRPDDTESGTMTEAPPDRMRSCPRTESRATPRRLFRTAAIADVAT